VIPQVQLITELDASVWRLLIQNLSALTDAELDWRPHPAAGSIRGIVGYLAWFEEWTTDALWGDGRYVTDNGPRPYTDLPFVEVRGRLEMANGRYRRRVDELREKDLRRRISFLRKQELSVLDLLRMHPLHVAGHRFQIRYIRAAYSRMRSGRNTVSEPWAAA
jgi:hypothetical protein